MSRFAYIPFKGYNEPILFINRTYWILFASIKYHFAYLSQREHTNKIDKKLSLARVVLYLRVQIALIRIQEFFNIFGKKYIYSALSIFFFGYYRVRFQNRSGFGFLKLNSSRIRSRPGIEKRLARTSIIIWVAQATFIILLRNYKKWNVGDRFSPHFSPNVFSITHLKCLKSDENSYNIIEMRMTIRANNSHLRT